MTMDTMIVLTLLACMAAAFGAVYGLTAAWIAWRERKEQAARRPGASGGRGEGSEWRAAA